MPAPQPASIVCRGSRAALGLIALAGVALIGGPGLAAGFARPLEVKVEDASAKVGEKTAVVARVTVGEGYELLKSYRNRIIMLSSLDDGVRFDSEVVPGSVEDGGLVFSVEVVPTKPGAHPINGVFRVGYHDGHRMDMVSLPLIATVTGVE